MKKLLLAITCLMITGALLADQVVYEAQPTGDGAYIVTKDGGKTQVGGVHTTEDGARSAANKLNKQQKKLDKKLDK